VNRGGLLISHLAFVDDLILFVEANMDQVDVINLTLELFSDSSGAKVNVDKTKSFLFPKMLIGGLRKTSQVGWDYKVRMI